MVTVILRAVHCATKPNEFFKKKKKLAIPIFYGKDSSPMMPETIVYMSNLERS